MASIVYSKAANGKTYAYKNTSIWDKKARRVKHIRECIGHLDPKTNEIVPNRKKGDAVKRREEIAPAKHCTVKGIGLDLLFSHMAESIGLNPNFPLGILHA